jgi:hypothetical protein
MQATSTDVRQRGGSGACTPGPAGALLQESEVSEDRDWANTPYVRVYRTIRTDPKFAAVFDDDRALAAWLRLLMDADAMYPAQPYLPTSLSRYARDLLVKAGLLVIHGRTYSMSGLVKERESRSSRYGKDGTGRLRYPSDVGVKSESDISPSPVRARAHSSVSVFGTRSSAYDAARAREIADNFDRRVEATQRMLKETNGE